MVQRGFGIKRGRDHHIWVYSKEAKPKQTVTRKHGAEEHFFSLDGDSTADEVLTSFENSIQSHLQMVRTYPDGTAVESEFMAPVISHLEIRSLFIRDAFSKLGKRAVEKIGDIFGSKRKTSALMLNYFKSHPELLTERLDQLNVPQETQKIVAEFFEINLQGMIEKQSDELSLLVQQIIGPILEEVEVAAKSGHIKGVSAGFTETQRTDAHRQFKYAIRKAETPLILPDTGLAVFKDKGVSPVSQKGDKVTDIIVPLDKSTYIHGFLKHHVRRSSSTVLRALASCSYQNFVAHEDNEVFRRVTSLIGKNARLLSEKDIAEALSFEQLLAGISQQP